MPDPNYGADSTIVVRFGGEGGQGTITLGDLFTRIAARSGLEVYSFRTYPAEIKGGQVTYQTRLGAQRVLSEGDEADVMVSLNRQAWMECHEDLCAHSAFIHEASLEMPAHFARTYPIPAAQIARQHNWERGYNFVFLGALLWFFHWDVTLAEEVVRKRMHRHPQTLDRNLIIMRAGYTYARQHYPTPPLHTIPQPKTTEERLILSGADALALGALAAGCKFYAGYPITPATPVMEALAEYLPSFDGSLIQAEDEIAAINMAIGGSIAGQRSMTATSGPGLSLMIEAMGLASMTETPLVVLDVQRAGPSTGLPTKTSQGDLLIAMYGSHGAAPRFVLAPDSVKDCYYQMFNAFSLSEYFQMPVVVLCDQAMASRVETVPYPHDLWEEADEPFPWCRPLERRRPMAEELQGDYRRYRDTENGISPMAEPGMPGGLYLAESLEHNEYGYPDQSPENHERMMAKRTRKVEVARKMLNDWKMSARRWGHRGAPFGIIGWGSTRGAVREAMAMLEAQGIFIEALYPHSLRPMPDKAVLDFLDTKKAILIPELNFTGQFRRVIEHHYYKDLDVRDIHVHQLTKEQGLPFKVREIYNAVLKMIAQERQQWVATQGDLVNIYEAIQQLQLSGEVSNES